MKRCDKSDFITWSSCKTCPIRAPHHIRSRKCTVGSTNTDMKSQWTFSEDVMRLVWGWTSRIISVRRTACNGMSQPEGGAEVPPSLWIHLFHSIEDNKLINTASTWLHRLSWFILNINLSNQFKCVLFNVVWTHNNTYVITCNVICSWFSTFTAVNLCTCTGVSFFYL